jgi:hypothetical protein
MKPTNIFKEIFRLAVRLVGLFFLCIGMKDLFLQTFVALTQLRGASLVNIISTFIPACFTLAMAVWLLRGTWLIRMAYPEPERNNDLARLPAKQEEPESHTAASKGLSDMEVAEEKLAALVGKPKNS